MWLLERASGRLGRLSGCVQPARPAADYAPATFRPDPENPSPPTLRLFEGLAWPAGERPQALALASDGTLALLSWAGDGESRLRLLDRQLGTLGAAQTLGGAAFAYSIDWLSEGRVAARLPGRRDAPVWVPRVAPPAALTLTPAGDIYPLAAEAEEAPSPTASTIRRAMRWRAAGSSRSTGCRWPISHGVARPPVSAPVRCT